MRLGDGVDGDTIARALARVVHPGLAAVTRARVEDGHLVVDEVGVEGHALADEARPTLVDKVIALGAELLPALRALADAGIAHGRLDAARVVRREDGALVVVGAAGLTAEGRAATSADDVRALLVMMRALLPERTPEVTRRDLDALIAAEPPLDTLHARLVALRAAVPIPAGRHIRSIQRLAFPHPPAPKKKSKRYMLRVLLTSAIVGLGLYAAFDAAGPGAASGAAGDAPARALAPKRPDEGVVYLKLPPLPPRRHDEPR